MARLPRLSLPGYPHHVVLRGNNRQLIFKDNSDRQTLLELLVGHCQNQQVDLHAFVLMDNHLHLLVTPQADQALSKMMQNLGRDYVRYFNKRHTRTGTLWEGRFRSALIQTDRYFLACMIYIDLNPVRAGMVAQALDHPWSSHSHYVGARQDKWLVPHALYWALGNTPFAREKAYAELVQAGIEDKKKHALTSSVMGGWVLGEDAFMESLQPMTSRRISKVKAGRPFKPGEQS
jgi:putative transposase